MVLKRALVYVSSVSLAGAMPVMLPDSGDGGEVVATIQIPAQSPAAGRRTLRWLSGSLPSRLPTVHRTPAQFPDMVLDRRLARLHYAVHGTEMVPLWQDPRLLRAMVYQSQRAQAASKPPTAPSVNSSTTASAGASHGRAASLESQQVSRSARRGQALSSRSADTPLGMDAGVRIAAIALSLVGARYVWGGTGPDGFDCSGFVQYVYRKAGVFIPRTSYQQFEVGRAIGWSALRPGDLMFFDTSGGPSHVAVYVGNGLMVQALNARTGVIVSHIDAPYFRERFVGARRPLY